MANGPNIFKCFLFHLVKFVNIVFLFVSLLPVYFMLVNKVYEEYDCITVHYYFRLRGTVVERRSLAGELPLSCARPAADG